MGFEQPVTAVEKVELGLRHVTLVGTRGAFGHVAIVCTPDDEGGRVVFAKVSLIARKPGEIVLQPRDNAEGDRLPFSGHQGPVQSPEIGRNLLREGRWKVVQELVLESFSC